MVIPLPGPARMKHHSGFFTCEVMLMGLDQVLPSSSLRTSMNWPVSSGFMPGPDPIQDRLPWLQVAATQIVPVLRSTSTAGSPIPS